MPWPVHPTGFFGARGGDSDTYKIERSLRFNSADSAYLDRTPASAGSQTKWTMSIWVKRSKLGASQAIFSAGTSNITFVSFQADDTLRFRGTTVEYVTTQVFRDPSSWNHIVFVWDSSNATASNRLKIYNNGLEITSYSTQTTAGSSESTIWNSAVSNQIGRYAFNGTALADFYLTEIHFIDGQALTPSSFGETDAITGRWKAKAYSGTYGTNGFYLNFSDNSSLTTTSNVGIGKDFSGNTNYWATNGISIDAGAGNDSLVDSPTNYGSDSYSTSIDNARGCYCTLNPVHLAGATLSNGNLSATCPTGTTYYFARGTFVIPQTGKWYFETIVTTVGQYPVIGAMAASSQIVSSTTEYVGGSTNSAGWFGGLDAIYANASQVVTGLTSLSNGDVIMCAVSDNKVYLGRNGTWANSGDPVAGTGSVLTATADLVPAISLRGSPTAPVVDLNFGQRPFAYTAPSGFKALCTQNLTQPTIQKPSTAMDVVTYTGTGASQSISSLGFSPDLVWIKGRSGATDHALYDVIRGSQARLESNTTDAEVTSDDGLTLFDSAGFTVGTLAQVNTNTATYVGWSWDAGSTNSTNTSGSITSTVRANPQAGFSIVSYAGNGSGSATVGHSLGVTPAMIILKPRSGTYATEGWSVYHKSLSASNNLRLNSTSAQAGTGTYTSGIISTSPTSSVFGFTAGGSGTPVANVNDSATTYIAYCFSEIEGYSKFGSYTGNGSSDGPFVWCGFRPALVIAKNTGGTGNWTILDNQREGYNVDNDPLFPNLSNAEGTTDLFDFLSNGFKTRSTDSSVNTSGTNYIFAAFAEAPFKYARAR